MNKKLKNFLIGCWNFLVIFAYVKFYFLCFMGTMLSLLCSMWILNEAGRDIAQIAAGFKWVGYFGTVYLAIIMADKLRELFQRGSK